MKDLPVDGPEGCVILGDIGALGTFIRGVEKLGLDGIGLTLRGAEKLGALGAEKLGERGTEKLGAEYEREGILGIAEPRPPE